MSREEELAKLKQQAADFQSQGVGGPSRAAGPLSARLQLTESDSEFMRQLAQLKEDHVANLRVIERMYNEGQGGGGSALPDYDDGYAERTDDALLRAPLDAAFEARVAEQERRAAAARSQAGAAATHDGAPRPNFARPLDAGLPDDEYPPPPPPPQDLPLASTSRAHLPPRPASAGPSRSRSLGDRHGQSRAAYQPTVSADGEADAAAPADGLSQRLAASSSMDDLNPRDDGRREYDPLAAAAAVRRRPASAPRERPRGITIPRPFNFDSRPPRESTSMRRLRLELQERDAQLREGRNSVRHVPLPPSTKEPRYEQICTEAAARVKQRREGRKEAEMLASAKPFSFHKPVEKKPPPPEPDLQVTFRATPVPPAVHEPLWEIIQHREAGRQERVAREAQALYQKRQLSNKDSKREEERQARRAREMQKIKAEVHKDHTFHPKVRQEPLPDFEEKQRRFEKSLQAAKESNPHRKVKHEEFKLLTDKLRGGHHRPAPEQLEMVANDIARDNIVRPEERWPFRSTRAKVPPAEPPDFKALHNDPRMPMYRSTTSAELRKACVEEAELKQQLRARREEQKEAKRLAALREVSKEVARAMGNGSANLNKQQAEKTLRERFKADAREKQKEADERLAKIREKVADRPFLFQRQSADANALRAKQAQYDKFHDKIREHGLGHLLEKMPYS